MTEQEAKSRAIKETDYCYVLGCAWSGAPNDSICFERIYVKGAVRRLDSPGGRTAIKPIGLQTSTHPGGFHYSPTQSSREYLPQKSNSAC